MRLTRHDVAEQLCADSEFAEFLQDTQPDAWCDAWEQSADALLTIEEHCAACLQRVCGVEGSRSARNAFQHRICRPFALWRTQYGRWTATQDPTR